MSGEVEQNDLAFPGFPAFQGFADSCRDGVAGFRRRDYPLVPGKQNTGLERLVLSYVHCLHVPVFQQLGDYDPCPVVPQSSGMNVRRGELMPERVHRKKRGIACLVPEVILEFPVRQLWTGFRLCRDEPGPALPGEDMAHEREGNAAEI